MYMSETPEQVMRWFQAAVRKLSAVAAGSLSLRKSPCIRKNCPACASGVSHPSHALYGRHNGKRFSIYAPDELVPKVRDAIANGRRVQALVTEAGIRYAKALKAKRSYKRLTDEEKEWGADDAMLNERDFAARAYRVKLSEPAVSVLAQGRRSDPVRRVGGLSNVRSRYPSRKMGRATQFESHRVELPAIFKLEHDDSALEGIVNFK
jgi:hypothetical protein